MLPVHVIPNTVVSPPDDDCASPKSDAEYCLKNQWEYGNIVESILQIRQCAQSEPQTNTHSKVLEDLSLWYKSSSNRRQTNNKGLATIPGPKQISVSASFQYHEAVLSVVLNSATQGDRGAFVQSVGRASIREIISCSNNIEGYIQDR
jgi:hypothetical protein